MKKGWSLPRRHWSAEGLRVGWGLTPFLLMRVRSPLLPAAASAGGSHTGFGCTFVPEVCVLYLES